MQITIKGRLGREPVLAVTPDGKHYLRSSVAENYWQKVENGPPKHKGAFFYEFIAYDDNAKKIAELKKGAPISFSGFTNLVVREDKPNKISLVVQELIPQKDTEAV